MYSRVENLQKCRVTRVTAKKVQYLQEEWFYNKGFCLPMCMVNALIEICEENRSTKYHCQVINLKLVEI